MATRSKTFVADLPRLKRGRCVLFRFFTGQSADQLDRAAAEHVEASVQTTAGQQQQQLKTFRRHYDHEQPQ